MDGSGISAAGLTRIIRNLATAHGCQASLKDLGQAADPSQGVIPAPTNLQWSPRRALFLSCGCPVGFSSLLHSRMHC